MIEVFRQMLDVEPIDDVSARVPQDAFIGDECRCDAEEGDLQ